MDHQMIDISLKYLINFHQHRPFEYIQFIQFYFHAETGYFLKRSTQIFKSVGYKSRLARKVYGRILVAKPAYVTRV